MRLAREGRTRARDAGAEDAETAPLHLEAAGTRLLQRYEEARALYVESLELNRRAGNAAVVAMEQHNLGWVELHLGDVDAAQRWFAQRDAGSRPDAYGDAWHDLNHAAVAAGRGRWAEARKRFDAGIAALAKLGVVLDPDDAFEREWLEHQLAQHAC